MPMICPKCGRVIDSLSTRLKITMDTDSGKVSGSSDGLYRCPYCGHVLFDTGGERL